MINPLGPEKFVSVSCGVPRSASNECSDEAGIDLNDTMRVSGSREEKFPVRIHLQSEVVEEPRTEWVSRQKLEEILEQRRFLVSDGSGVGFSEEEKQCILDGKSSTFNAKLNVCLHATSVMEMYEGFLGKKLDFPTKFYHHYQGQVKAAESLLEAGIGDSIAREKLEGFIRDLGRTVNSDEDKKVFLNLAPSNHIEGPAFNVGKNTITLVPYPVQYGITSMRYPDRDPDCVAHETGHLAQSCIRPGWDEAKYAFPDDFETSAFRESFADVTALLYALSHPHTCARVLEECSGDLSRGNRAARISEEGSGSKLDDYFRQRGVPPKERYIRNLLNDYVYVNRDEAPVLEFGELNVGMLFNDNYSYSQIVSGAVYDILTEVFNEESAKTQDSVAALMTSARKTGFLTAKAVELGPWWRVDFKSFARCMLHADLQENGGEWGEILERVFVNRNLLSRDDIAEVRGEVDSLPSLNMSEIPDDGAEAARIFLSRGIALDAQTASFQEVSRYTNESGETFLSYSMERPVTGDGYEAPFDLSTAILGEICDLTPDVRDRGSLVLKFSSSGDLVYRHQEDFRRVDISQHYLKIRDMDLNS